MLSCFNTRNLVARNRASELSVLDNGKDKFQSGLFQLRSSMPSDNSAISSSSAPFIPGE